MPLQAAAGESPSRSERSLERMLLGPEEPWGTWVQTMPADRKRGRQTSSRRGELCGQEGRFSWADQIPPGGKAVSQGHQHARWGV